MVKYKRQFFVALIASGPEYYATFDHYEKHDHLYRLVGNYADLERMLDGRLVVRNHATIDRVKPGVLRSDGCGQAIYNMWNLPYADNGL